MTTAIGALIALDQIERFRDGAIGPQERHAAMRAGAALAQRIHQTNETLRRCRVGRMVDRRSTAEKIAQEMLRCVRIKGDCTERDLRDAGFTRGDLEQHGSSAHAIARGLYVRQDGPA